MPSSAPVLTRPQLVTVIVAVLAVAAAIVAAATIVPPAVRAANPELPVRAYLQAVVKGDVTQAVKIGRITPGGDDKLLTDAAYDQASDRITSFTVLATTATGTTGTVRARVTQGGDSYIAGFDITRASTNPFAPWRLAKQQLPEITVKLPAPTGLKITVGGVEFPASSTSVTQRVFPGTYEASSHTGSVILARSASATATFAAAHSAPAVMSLELVPEGQVQADAEVNAWLTACLASTDLHPEGCPFQAVPEASVTYSNGNWTMQAQPVFDTGDWSDLLGGWPVTTSRPGYVTFSARARQNGLAGTATTGSNPFSVAGTIVPDASGALHFTPSANYSSPSAAGSLT
ncbi:hypothetical protein [Gryllotalpicola protaetiae]|uniref:DUF4878 domain-containing protein n=1 Tax=Gryllotalpicola protaetiae TaxID=2419771 RepID=A0A387BPW1_9MICO|nr:hypothetical protein [Gryllotalpicola protaetiae]AYG02996.1 hypothetical protein D7I44_05285 [Gryllotalpicola protaetiae]